MKNTHLDFFQKMKMETKSNTTDIENLHTSIFKNLSRILGSIQTTDDHPGDYGIPDFTQYFSHELKSLQDFSTAILKSILTHEYRLKNAKVAIENPKELSSEINIVIYGDIFLERKKENLEFYFSPITKKILG